MKKVQQGFTLIELMIVVAIIGILAAIAIPQYQDYITRAKWQDNIAQVAAFKTAIAECVQNQAGVLANCDTDAKVTTVTGAVFPVPVKELATVTYAGNVMTLTGTAAVKSCVVTITPKVSATSVVWDFATTTCAKAQTGY
ncbi:MAG: prepilin-type N-terminal cleavage/methylation domain-containing protein [Betaproteobacteria bacterium]|nr:prepilin-type N-terminal cleavage/methylation domain-containing protein [Betaproteobacteria bacterium]